MQKKKERKKRQFDAFKKKSFPNLKMFALEKIMKSPISHITSEIFIQTF